LAEDTDISGKIGIMGAARRLSLLAQNEKAGDQIDGRNTGSNGMAQVSLLTN
jgi:hypothetical protein